MVYFLIFLFALVFALLGLYIFKKLNILDRPWPDVPPRKRVPNMQGVVLFVGFLLTLLIFFPQYLTTDPVISILIWWGLLVLIYVLDIYFKIPPWIRLIFQIGAALIVYWLGWIRLSYFYIQGNMIHFPEWLSLILTVFWFVFFINALNWFDWINWMASGLSAIWFLTIALLLKFVVIPSYPHMTQVELERLLFTIDLAIIFFIWSLIYAVIEWKPWGILRDVWIVFLGYWLASLSLLWGAKIWALIVVLSLMIFDAIWVGLYRIFVMRKSPLKGDYTHLHHRLQNFWWTRGEVKVFVLAWSIFWMILLILQGTNTIWKIIFAILMAVVFFGVNIYLFLIKKKKVEFLPERLKE